MTDDKMASFNVLNDKWIYVIDERNERKFISLLDLLKNAHQYKEITDFNKFNEFSVYRFIITFVMDAYHPSSEEEIVDIFESGSFDMDVINQYIKLCEDNGVRFDLFDEVHPFMQKRFATDEEILKLDNDKTTTISGFGRLRGEEIDIRMSANKHRSMTGSALAKHNAVKPCDCFKDILTVYLFAPGNQCGFGCANINGIKNEYMLLTGKNVFETIVFSMTTIPEEERNEHAYWFQHKMNPYSMTKKAKLEHMSTMLRMLYPNRFFEIKAPQKDGLVREVFYAPTSKYVGPLKDPHCAYKIDKDGIIGNTKRFNPEVALWRELPSLLVEVDNKVFSSLKILDTYINYFEMDTVNIATYGVDVQNTSMVYSFRKSSISLPKNIVKSTTNQRAVNDVLKKIESCAITFNKTILACSKRSKGDSSCKCTLNENRLDDAKSLFFNQCEKDFYKFIDIIIRNESAEKKGEVVDNMTRAIEKNIMDAFDCYSNVDKSASAIIASTKVRESIRKNVKRVLYTGGKEKKCMKKKENL